MTELKKEFDAKNTANLEAAIERLNNAFQAASQDMYNASNEGGATEAQNTGNPGDEVTDVDFEEVDDKTKK